MARIEVDEHNLKSVIVYVAMDMSCGDCPMDFYECKHGKYKDDDCFNTLLKWLTEKPIGYDVENDGR